MSSEGKHAGFEARLAEERRRIETRCGELVAELLDGPPNVREAVEYALLGGGKRLRPLLCLWTHEAYGGGNTAACLDAACAIECLHTYSLVHDDLPCMDDDDMRRGRASCHKRFGEAVAVLAGDALLTLCFEILAGMGKRARLGAETVVELSRVVARAAGGGGLIVGQALDLASGGVEGSVETVERIHRYKTAALIGAAMEGGAILAGVDTARRQRAREAGLLAGQAFQIVDDVLDLCADGDTLGKTPGKDARDGKLTYPAVAGVDASKARARELITEATALVEGETGAARLVTLLDTMVQRAH